MQKQRKTSNTTTSEIVLESLREQIINGILQPQEKLVEAEIARKFGLSRGPVREALRQLVSAPSVTQDGHSIRLYANIAGTDDLPLL